MTFKQKYDHELFGIEQDILDLEEEISAFCGTYPSVDSVLARWMAKLMAISDKVKDLQED